MSGIHNGSVPGSSRPRFATRALATGALVSILALGLGSTAHAEDILYYVDFTHDASEEGGDPILEAAANLGHTVTIATSWADFDAKIVTAAYQMAFALKQNQVAGGPSPELLRTQIDEGRGAVLVNWMMDNTNPSFTCTGYCPEYGGIFGVTYTGTKNLTPCNINEPRLVEDVTNPVALENEGWNTFDVGLVPSGGGISLGDYQLPTGFGGASTSCIVMANGGRSLVLGFLSDAVTDSQDVQFFENLITYVIDKASGCQSNFDCTDSNACTNDFCRQDDPLLDGVCVNTLRPNCCNSAGDCADGDPCTLDVCSGLGGMCSSNPITGCCQTDDACDDGSECTTDTCDLETFSCTTAPVEGCCFSNADCNDDDGCTADLCDLETGMCSNASLGADCCNTDADCSDGNTCTFDQCSGPGGMCASTTIEGCCATDADCDDDNACTVDACDVALTSCTNTELTGCCETDAECDDGDACTMDACTDSVCVSSGSCDAMPAADAGVDAMTNNMPPDAASAPDAPVAVVPDAAAASDAAGPDAGGEGSDSGGCGCATTPATNASWLWLVGLVAMVLTRRRRRDL